MAKANSTCPPDPFRCFLILIVMVVAASLVTAGCTKPVDIETGTTQTLSRQTMPVGEIYHPFDLFEAYHIAPGDVLDVLFQIQTWKEKDVFKLAADQQISVYFENTPELNVTQKIRPDGTISLPHIGKIHITGTTVDELTQRLEKRYAKLLQIPDLYIVISDFRTAIKELKEDLHTAPRGLSRLVTVRPDGYVTFPMVGDLFVAGKSIPEVNQTLNDQYATIVEGLHCDLFLERHSGSLIYIAGQVKKPGAYKIIRPISVFQALTLAGDVTPGAQLDSVIVARKHNGKMVATRIDLTQLLRLSKGAHLTYLQPEDLIFVPQTRISKAAEIAQYIKQITFFNGWGATLSWELYDASEN